MAETLSMERGIPPGLVTVGGWLWVIYYAQNWFDFLLFLGGLFWFSRSSRHGNTASMAGISQGKKASEPYFLALGGARNC